MNYCVALFTLGSFILSIHVLICKLWLITAFVIISIIYFKAVHQAFGQALLTLFDLLYVQCLFAKKNYHISQPCVSSVKPCCYFPGASASGMVVGKKKGDRILYLNLRLHHFERSLLHWYILLFQK